MIVFTKGSFQRDVSTVSDTLLLKALNVKIEQLEEASDISHVTGLKLLQGYKNHFRIYVKTTKQSYRVGAIIRSNTIWLVRFLPRKKIYKQFP